MGLISRGDVERMTAHMKDENYVPSIKDDSTPNYRTGDAWRRNKNKMLRNEKLIYAMAIRGCSQKEIAAAFSVSRECIAKRLRPIGVLPGKGRPKNSESPIKPREPSQMADNQSSYPVAMLWHRGY